jgi:hypothetical protein
LAEFFSLLLQVLHYVILKTTLPFWLFVKVLIILSICRWWFVLPLLTHPPGRVQVVATPEVLVGEPVKLLIQGGANHKPKTVLRMNKLEEHF